MSLYRLAQFSVDSTGAYITELYDHGGNPVFFPRTRLGEKTRGGSHVCLPYFNPDEAGVMPQHGFGREVEWDIQVEGDRIVECRYLEARERMFKGLQATIRYELSEQSDSLTTTLAIENNGPHPFMVSPGFHPYFAIDPDNTTLNDGRVQLSDFEPFRSYPDRTHMRLVTTGRTVTVESDSLMHMVAWSDARGGYLCIEPTRTGGGFNSQAPTVGDSLAPGQRSSYAYTVSWHE